MPNNMREKRKAEYLSKANIRDEAELEKVRQKVNPKYIPEEARRETQRIKQRAEVMKEVNQGLKEDRLEKERMQEEEAKAAEYLRMTGDKPEEVRKFIRERYGKGGAVYKMEHGGAVTKTAKRSVDGCAIRGKTRAVRNV
jgi:2,3-bisphosphoglycerate-independent phosphoglycerate mutase